MKYLPWGLSALLLAALVLVWTGMQAIVGEKEAEIARLDAEVARLVAVLEDASRPEATVLVSYRAAVFASGLVAVLKNTSPGPVAITLDARRPLANQGKSFSFVVDGGSVREIGENEGWAFVSGDTITISQPGHKSLAYSIP